jgi:hypothetical protein
MITHLPFNLEHYLDTQELAKIVHRSPGSLARDRLLRRGIPFVRIGSLVRYNPQAVREYLKSLEAR